MSAGEPLQIIASMRRDIELAADAMLTAAEQGLQDVRLAREGASTAFDRLDAKFYAILEACAFQDLGGQRLSQLEAALGAAPQVGGPALQLDGGLLNGPAAAGGGLDQDAIDALIERGG